MRGEVFDLEEKEQGIAIFQEFIRNQTINSRGWGYFSQIERILLELYSPYDDLLKEKIGFSPSDAIIVFSHIARHTEQFLAVYNNTLNDLFKISNSRQLIRKYNSLRNANADEKRILNQAASESSFNREAIMLLIGTIENQNLSEIFSLSIAEISDKTGIDTEIVNLVFNYFSLEPGDLEENNAEHFFLDNPIWKKPIIRYKNEHFSPVPYLFFSNSFANMDSMIGKYFKDSLHTKRSSYLEQRIEEIVKSRFSKSMTVSRVKWSHQGRIFETDLITFIDSYAIIIEAKSHKISQIALRGAPDRIKRQINELIINPSIQSKRLEGHLNYLILNPDVDDELRLKLPVDLNNIKKILRLSVSLENFAGLQSIIGSLKGTGWIPESFELCPTLSLADFETVFDFLDHPVHIIHYFERRAELLLDDKIEIIGDEMDYLGLYSATLFNQDYIIEEEKYQLNI
ncbi:hypothetical protein LEP1GSC151_0556, partial [Leptospira interrogans serovar Grippotyphosa str. LT2186]